MNVRRGTPVVESIVLSEDNIEKINQILTSRICIQYRNHRLRNLVGGFCIVCRGIPSKKVIYSPMEGVKLVDFYCDADFDKFMRENKEKKVGRLETQIN